MDWIQAPAKGSSQRKWTYVKEAFLIWPKSVSVPGLRSVLPTAESFVSSALVNSARVHLIMNTALFHAARPGDIGDDQDRLSGRMREAAAVAKQMGLGGGSGSSNNPGAFGKEASNLWKMLDDLAATDSAGYAAVTKEAADAVMMVRVHDHLYL